MDGVTSSPASGCLDDDNNISVAVVVQHSASSWVGAPSRRASWHPALHHDTVTVTLPRSAGVAELIRGALELSPPADLPPPSAADYDLVAVELDRVGRAVAERLLPPDQHVSRLPLPGQRRRLELRACSRRRAGSCATAVTRLDSAALSAGRRQRDCPADLCDLPELSEMSLLDSLRRRFDAGAIYTYVGAAILLAVNPFRYSTIYNPKYVALYQGGRRRDLAPHVFAVADAAYTALVRRRADQCVVISGESGSGKTQTANLVLNHLSTLSRRIFYSDSKVEQSILSAGPVLEVPPSSSLSINQSCIFRVVQVTKSLQDPLEVGNNLPGISDNVRE